MASYKTAYEDNHTAFEISDIEYDDDQGLLDERPDSITFEYTAPNISVDAAGRFATHEIIGGTTVRQKIGEDPVEVQVEGVCKESTARLIDGLREAKYGTIYSNRLVGGSLDVHFASISTSPMENGGAVAMSDPTGEFLYEFDLSCIEVELLSPNQAVRAP